MQHDPPSISNKLAYTSYDHTDDEAPALVVYALCQVQKKADSKENNKANIGCEVGAVLVEGEFRATDGDGAIAVGAIGHIAVWWKGELSWFIDARGQGHRASS